MTFNIDVIPVELRERAQWLVWRLVDVPGRDKPTKVPFRASAPLVQASSTDPASWATFDTAIEAASTQHGAKTVDGVGYVFAGDHTGVDLDDCIDENGLLHPAAAAIVLALDSYTERSPSGTGVKIFIRADLNGFPRNRTSKTLWGGEFEVYSTGRYFTVTGEHLVGTPLTIEERQAKLDEVLAVVFGDITQKTTTNVGPVVPVDLDDRDLLNRMFASKHGTEIEQLWNGNITGHGDDQSRADLALCAHLAFWTNRDAARTDALFRQSALVRDKWTQRQDYIDRTIEKAISSTSDGFRPSARNVGGTRSERTRASESHVSDTKKTDSRPRPATSSRPRPQVTSSLVPSPYGGDEVEHLVPDLVPTHPTAHSWAPLDLVARGASPPAPPELIGLFYLRYNHLVSGESEALKTWLAMAAAVAELALGRGVLWVDGDEVGESAVLERLRLLGADDSAIASHFAYVLPDEPLGSEHSVGLVEFVRDRSCRLAVMDGFNPLMGLHGLNPDSGTDVEQMYRLLNPVRRENVAVLWTDNVVKAREARGAWAIGSERKKSKAEVHLGMTKIEPLVRGGTGKAKIDVHKDRPGHLVRPSPGIFVVESGTGGYVWNIRDDESRTPEGDFRPTNLMEKVSRYLERQVEPPSRNLIEQAKLGKAEYVRIALDLLVEEGYATAFLGPRNARLVRLERSFREEAGDE